jgi:peptide chain release factor
VEDPQVAARLQALGVRADDVDESFVLGSGPGGQKINKTSSTVQLRHAKSGVLIRVQSERSQAQNREEAWRRLAEACAERRAKAEAAEVAARERERRRRRQKSKAQKARMVAEKRIRTTRKSGRGKVQPE